MNTDQLKEIRKITLARILCTNADSVDQIHPFVFLQPGKAPSYFRWVYLYCVNANYLLQMVIFVNIPFQTTMVVIHVGVFKGYL